MSIGLAQRLREGTRALHSTTERAGVMPALLRGALPAAQFHRLQRNLLVVYAALEPALQRHAAHPLLAPLPLAGLARSTVLAADLQALHGADWATALPVAGAAQAYAERLRRLDWADPGMLAAHAYVRYLGDLNGGQALCRLVQRAYALAGSEGTGFYDFGPPDQVAALALAFRQALDRLPVDEDQAQALVAEARWSFSQHARLFAELQADDLLPA